MTNSGKSLKSSVSVEMKEENYKPLSTSSLRKPLISIPFRKNVNHYFQGKFITTQLIILEYFLSTGLNPGIPKQVSRRTLHIHSGNEKRWNKNSSQHKKVILHIFFPVTFASLTSWQILYMVFQALVIKYILQCWINLNKWVNLLKGTNVGTGGVGRQE